MRHSASGLGRGYWGCTWIPPPPRWRGVLLAHAVALVTVWLLWCATPQLSIVRSCCHPHYKLKAGDSLVLEAHQVAVVACCRVCA